MKILLAGASGAIGRPLINLLIQEEHEVYGITQSQDRSRLIEEKGAKPVILNVLDRQAVFAALTDLKPEIVIDMLTSLPKEYTSESMSKAAEMDAKIRQEGGFNLQAAAEINRAKRYIALSTGFYYAPGTGLADETVPFAFEATPGIAAGAHVYSEIENRVLNSSNIEGVALRFGFFYGPGTWYYPGENMDEQLQKQQFPIIGQGEGIWSFVHIDDAAKAAVLALKCPPGVYNIVNDQPLALNEWLPAFASFLKAPQPLKITEEAGLQQKGADLVYYATKLRGASNAKAKQQLRFQPRRLEWLATS